MSKTADTVTVTWGEQGLQPVQFNGFRFGPFSMTTEVRDGESPADAMARAYKHLDQFARKHYAEAKDTYLKRLEEVGLLARGGRRG